MDIKEEDLKTSTFYLHRRGGAWAWVAVRVTHIPTGKYCQSSGERSQWKNRERAGKLLAKKLRGFAT